MSLPEYIQLELKLAKKKLRFALGDLVVPVEAKNQKPFCVTGFLPIGSVADHSHDYTATRLSRRGKLIHETFRQKELKPFE